MRGFDPSATVIALSLPEALVCGLLMDLGKRPLCSVADPIRSDVRIKSQRDYCNGGDAPSEKPKEPRRNTEFENGERKTIYSTYQKIRYEKYDINGNINYCFFCEDVKHK